MGLFKDFKEDLSQAVNEMVPETEPKKKTIAPDEMDNLVVDTLNDDVDVKKELSKLDGLLEQVKGEPVSPKNMPISPSPATMELRRDEENRSMSDNRVMEQTAAQTAAQAVEKKIIEDETSVITASTVLTGDLSTAGSFDIQGTINGNVTCNGKVVVTGTINGNTTASEFFADVANVEGEVVSSGTVKIGTGSVIIGNITAASAVIAGAVKGDIDVQGPVVVDTSAVVMGNIKSRSVQINNGAVIEGFCSQCYADVDVQGVFNR